MATQNKKSLNKKFFEDLKARQLTEEEQKKFSRLIYNQNFCSAGEMEAQFKKVHRDNVHALMNDCHDTPQDSYFYEIVGFLNMVVNIIEQISDGGSFPLSTEQFFMLIKASNSTGE